MLKENDVKATFFVSGMKLYNDLVNHRSDKTPAIVRRMYNEGHQIAGHTWAHLDMDQLDSQQRRHELVKGEIGFIDILGFFPTYMRPPFNICGAECETDVGELGYHVVSRMDAATSEGTWNSKLTLPRKTSNNIDGRDWAGNYTYAEEQFMARITSKGNRQGVRAWLGLAHDTHHQSVYRWTPFMIKNAKERGFKLVTVGECLNDPEENWYRDPLTGGALHDLPPKGTL
jgi:peptidoglycan/xylan/chitin deacetylase (PgdA/CDA1 family)